MTGGVHGVQVVSLYFYIEVLLPLGVLREGLHGRRSLGVGKVVFFAK